MKTLAPRSCLFVDALPAPDASWQGVDVFLTTNSTKYWCDGTQWIPQSAGAGVQNVFISPTAPVSPASPTYVWVQTGLGDGTDVTFWIEDGS